MTQHPFAIPGALTSARRLIWAAAFLVPGWAMATTTINHAFQPATLAQGDESLYRITIANDAGVGLTDANVTVLLGPNISIAPGGIQSNSCGFAGVTAVPGSQKVVLTNGTVPAKTGGLDGQCVVEVRVVSTVSGNHGVTIPANTVPNAVTAGYSANENAVPVFNSTAANATLLVTALAAPTGSKSFAPSPAFAGNPVTLTIQLNNPNSGKTMPLTSVTDTLPAGMVVAPVPNASVTCTGTGFANGTVGAVAGGNTIVLNGATIGQGGTCQLTASVVVASIAGSSENFTNALPSGAIGNNRGLTSPAFQAGLTVTAAIGMQKSFAPNVIPAGATSTMTLTVTNNSSVAALPISQFDDVFPAGMSLANPPNASVTCTGTGAVNGSLTDTGGAALVAGSASVRLTGATAGTSGNCTITANVTATGEALRTNTIAANAVQNPGGLSSPASSATLQSFAELRVAKSVSPSTVAPGQWAEFKIDISNYSGAPVTNASLTDNLPIVSGMYQMVLDGTPSVPVSDSCGFSYAAPSASQNQDGAPALIGSNGTIPAATGTAPGVCSVVFRARSPANAPVATTFVNTLPVGGVIGQGGSNTNGSAAGITTVDAVVVGKAFAPNAVAQGQSSVLTLTVRNRNVSALTAINLTDNLPPGLVLAANPAATSSCGGTLQAFPGSSRVGLTNGAVAARPDALVDSVCTITVRVVGTSTGGKINTIAPTDFSSSGGTIPTSVSATLNITSGLTGVKTFSPAATASGGRARVTVRTTNQTTGTLTGVSVNDSNFSANLTVANPANASSSCGGSPVLTVNPGAGSARLDGVELPAGASCDFSFDVTTTGPGPWANTIPIGNVTSAEGSVNSTAVTATLATRTAQLAINKAFNPVIVTGNQPSTLTIDVVNTSNAVIAGAGFVDVFPQGIQVYSVPSAQTTCPGATVAATPGGTQVALTGANLAANATCQVRVVVTSVEFLNLTNTIPAGAVTSTGGFTNAQPTSATLSTLQGVGVSKGFEPAYIAPGGISRLKVRLVSSFDPNIVNPTILTGVSYTDTLPAGLTFAAVPNGTSSCTNGTVLANIAGNAFTVSGVTLAPGASCDVSVDVTTAVSGFYLNQIPAGGVTSNEGVSNQQPAEAQLGVVAAPTVAKMFAASTVNLGGSTQLIVTITNPANAQSIGLTEVQLTDSLPPGVAVANPANAATTCSAGVVDAAPGTGTVSLSGANIAAGASCTFRADVVASTIGAHLNTIGANAIRTQQGLTNGNPADANLQVREPPSVAKSFTPAQIASGGVSTLRIRLNNTNAGAITLTSALVDALPGNVVVAPVPNVNASLGGATACPGAVTASAGAVSVSYANGAAIPAGGCTLTVDITSAAPGSYLNTIAAGQLATSAGANAEPAVATLGVDQPAAPTVAKSFAPTTVDVGGVSRLTITVSNPNAGVLTLASDLTDNLPANLVVANASNIGGTCTSGSVTAVPGAATVVYASGATIAAGGCSIAVDVVSAVAGSYTNTIAAGALQTVEAGSNPTATQAALVVRAATPPTVLKTFAPTTINPGATSRLTISLGNANPGTATLAADLVDTLPTNLSVAVAPAIGGSCTTASVTAGGSAITYLAGATIPNGGCTIEVDVTSSVSGGPYINTIAVGALQTNFGSNGAAAQAQLLVNPGQPPSIAKSFSPNAIGAGGTSTLTISLGNGNAGAATLSAALTDTLPSPVVIASPPAIQAGGGCLASDVTAVAGGNQVSVRAGAVIPAGGCAISVNVTSATAGAFTNTIGAGALQTNLGNNAVATQAQLTVLGAGGVASIAGRVYHDRNDNGTIEGGEEAIAGVVIRLTSNGGGGGPVSFTTTTDANGNYSFGNLPPGTYTLTETQPGGWTDGKDTAGSNGGTVTNDTIGGIVLAAGNNAVAYNFGERRPAEITSVPTLGPVGLGLLGLGLLLAAMRQRRRLDAR